MPMTTATPASIACVDYLRRATGKPVVTTEIGQHNTGPGVVEAHLRTLVIEKRLPLVLWFDADGVPAMGLHDAPGALRPNGDTFTAFVQAHDDIIDWLASSLSEPRRACGRRGVCPSATGSARRCGRRRSS
jgi:hypothetical protein